MLRLQETYKANLLKRLEDKIEKIPLAGCWIWVGATFTSGYGAVYFKKEGCYKNTIGAHRASWLAHRGDIPDDLQVLHRCDNRACVNPHHLFLGTHRDNMEDMADKGRAPRSRLFGSDHPQAKLVWEHIPQIKAAYAAGTTQRNLAVKYRVSQRTIWSVLNGQCWSQ